VKRLLILGLALALGGCVALPIAGAIVGAGGIVGTLMAIDQGAGVVLEAVQPMTKMWCADRMKEPHTKKGADELAAFCNHLPTDTATLLIQAVAVVAVVVAERDDAAHAAAVASPHGT